MIDRRFAAVLVGGIIVACGSFGAADDDDGPATGAADGSAEAPANADAGPPEDAAGAGDADIDASAGPTFCEQLPKGGAVACEDFDRGGAIGGGFSVINGTIALARDDNATHSEPWSGRMHVAAFDGGAVSGGLERTLAHSTQYRLAGWFRINRFSGGASNTSLAVARARLSGSPSNLLVQVIARYDETAVQVCQQGAFDGGCTEVTGPVLPNSFTELKLTVFPVTGNVLTEVGGMALATVPVLPIANVSEATFEVGVVFATWGGERTVRMDDVVLSTSF